MVSEDASFYRSGHFIASERLYSQHPSYGNPVIDYGYLFWGLPADNSGFGLGQIQLKVDSKDGGAANIQTFFTGSASNWPGSNPQVWTQPNGTTVPYSLPNWFYYYNQVYPCNQPGQPASYSSVGTSRCEVSVPPYQIYITPRYAYPSYAVRVFGVPQDAGPFQPAFVKYLGDLQLKGIHSYIEVVEHERGHQKISQHGNIYNAVDPVTNQPLSTDGDIVSDPWESTHHMDPNSDDTANAYAYAGEPGDTELVADIQALGGLMNNVEKWKEDWADQGIQKGFLQFRDPLHPYQLPTFKFMFYAAVDGSPSDNSTPPFQAGHGYPIQGLGDLSKQYSDCVIAKDLGVLGACRSIRNCYYI